MLDIGDTAPRFELPNQDETQVSLSDFEGQRVILYFYPKAMTPGCSREARTFQDHHDAFSDLGVAILGVSTDSVEEICKFADSEGLNFHLLADEDGTIASRYDSFGEREHEGQTWEVAFRNTYVIGPDGRIEQVYEDVLPVDHPSQVLADIERLTAE